MKNRIYIYFTMLIITCFVVSCSGEQFQSAVGGADVNTGAVNTINVVRSDDGSEDFFSVNKEFKASDFESVKLNLVGKDSFTQGVKGTKGSKVQSAQSKPLDILLIVDDSGSMLDEQDGLSDRLETLLDQVKHTDWQIAVITTEYNRKTKWRYNGTPSKLGPAAPCLVSLIKKGDTNYTEKFKALFKSEKETKVVNGKTIEIETNEDYIGTSGNDHEQAVLKAVYGLSQNIVCPEESDEYKNWLRTDSALAIVIVSDEDNCSSSSRTGICLQAVRETTTESASTTNIVKTDYYNEFKDKIYGFKEYVNEPYEENGVIKYRWSPASYEYQGVKYSPLGTDNIAIPTTLSGKTEEKYMQIKTIEENTAKFLTNYIEKKLGRTMGLNAKVFGLTPKAGCAVHSKYGTYSNTYNKLICESGATPERVTRDEGESDGHFTERYKTAFENISKGLLSIVDVFTIDTNKKLDPYIEVYLDNILLSEGYDFDSTSKTVSFHDGVIKDNSESVMFNYYLGSSRKYSFTLADKALKDSIMVTLDGRQLGFEEGYSYTKSNHRIAFASDREPPEENAKIEVSYLKMLVEGTEDKNQPNLKISVGDSLIHRIDQLIVMDSIRLNNDTVSDIIKDGQRITNSSGLGELNQDTGVLKFNLKDVKGMDNLELSYEHVTKRHKVFVVEEVNPKFIYTWKVLVDGVPAGYKDYEIKGNKIEFNDYLPINSTVSIQAYRDSNL